MRHTVAFIAIWLFIAVPRALIILMRVAMLISVILKTAIIDSINLSKYCRITTRSTGQAG